MERAPGRAFGFSRDLSFRWRVIGQLLPVTLLALAAFLVARNVTGGGSASPSPVTVDPNHAAILEANIRFFEERVKETNDSLSYNRLTGLYLQRLRETGDVANVRLAEQSANRSLEVNRGDYAGLVNLASVRVAEHEFEAAAALANQAIAAIPTRATGYAILGDAQFAMGQYDAATESYGKYLDLEPGFAAYSRQAVLAETRGNVPLAEQFWQASIDSAKQFDPEGVAWARVQLGTFEATLGRLDAAQSQFDQALKTYPGDVYALAGQGRVAAMQGNDGKAITLYRQASANVPVPDFVIALGDLERRAGHADEAAKQYALVGAIRQLFDANGIKNDLNLILFALNHDGNAADALARAEVAYEARPSTQAADVLANHVIRGLAQRESAQSRESECVSVMYRAPFRKVVGAPGSTLRSSNLLRRR